MDYEQITKVDVVMRLFRMYRKRLQKEIGGIKKADEAAIATLVLADCTQVLADEVAMAMDAWESARGIVGKSEPETLDEGDKKEFWDQMSEPGGKEE